LIISVIEKSNFFGFFLQGNFQANAQLAGFQVLTAVLLMIESPTECYAVSTGN